MTAADLRLAAAAACLAGARAAPLLSRGPSPAAEAEAARLAALPREERLHALAAALDRGEPSEADRAAELAPRERSRTAALVRRIAQGGRPGADVVPALARIVRERLAR